MSTYNILWIQLLIHFLSLAIEQPILEWIWSFNYHIYRDSLHKLYNTGFTLHSPCLEEININFAKISYKKNQLSTLAHKLEETQMYNLSYVTLLKQEHTAKTSSFLHKRIHHLCRSQE